MARDNDSISRISYGTYTRPSLERGEPFARRRRPFYNGVLSADQPTQAPEPSHPEPSPQGNNPGGWRSNLEVFASAEASSVANEDTTRRNHDVDPMQDIAPETQGSGERRNATCPTLLGPQFPAWQARNHEDVEMVDAAGARDCPPEAERAPLRSGEVECRNGARRRRNAGEMIADDEVEEEPGEVGVFLEGSRKRSRQY